MDSLLQTLYISGYYVLVVVVGIIFIQQYISWQRLSQFKGPLLASVTNLWMAYSISRRGTHLDLYEVSKKYGELTRIGPNTLLTSDPDLIQRMSAARSEYTRADWYGGQKLEWNHDNLISTLDDKEHTRRRAQMAIGYSGKEIANLEATIDSHVLALVNLITRKYISTASDFKPMDIARKVSFFAMDATCEIAFGKPWGCLTRDEDVDKWFECAEEVLPNAILCQTLPWLANLVSIPIIARMVMPSENDTTGAGRLIRIIKEIVTERFSIPNHEHKRDMMGSFVRHGITQTEAVSEATLAAGTDTSATAIRSALLYVMTNPHVYTALQHEIDSFSPAPPKAQNFIISDEDARNNPYLEAVIKESVRMCPPATGIVPKKTPPQGDIINGKFILGGVDIGQCAWGLQRSKTVFGEDSSLFRPERWLEAEGAELEKMEKSLNLAWGYGKYSCLGKNISWLEMNKVVFELFKRFDFTLIDPTNPWKSENVGLWLQSEMWVKVVERPSFDLSPQKHGRN